MQEDDSGPGAPPPPVQGPRAPRDDDVWVRDEVRGEAHRAVGRSVGNGGTPQGTRGRPTPDPEPAPRPGRPAVVPKDPSLVKVVGRERAGRVAERLKDASRAFDREQFTEARRLLRPLTREAPGLAAAHELLGLTYYRLGQWRPAVRELETFRDLTGSAEHHPVMADCYRALKRFSMVDSLWEELRAASPSAAVVTEGRIVVAGSLADRGRLAEGIALLDRGRRQMKRPQPHHLRQAYALADLRERSGDVPGARALFGWIARHDPTFADVDERSATLA